MSAARADVPLSVQRWNCSPLRDRNERGLSLPLSHAANLYALLALRWITVAAVGAIVQRGVGVTDE
jgi:hypothetical protein